MLNPAEVINYDVQTLLNRTMEYLNLTRADAKIYVIGLVVQDKLTNITDALCSLVNKQEQTIADGELFDMVDFSRESIDSAYDQVRKKAGSGSYSTQDIAEVFSIKLNSLSAGVQERFGERAVKENQDIAELGKRVRQDIINFGHKSTSETNALEYLKDHTKLDFELNEHLFYRDALQGELNGTPDAVYKQDGVIISVAEFKEYGGNTFDDLNLQENKTLSGLKAQGRKQLLLYMKICQVEFGYLVLTCKTAGFKVIERVEFDEYKFNSMISNKVLNYKRFRDASLLDQTFWQDIQKELKFKKC